MSEWMSQRQIREAKAANVRLWTTVIIMATVLLIQSSIPSCKPTVPSTREYNAAAAQREAARRAE